MVAGTGVSGSVCEGVEGVVTKLREVLSTMADDLDADADCYKPGEQYDGDVIISDLGSYARQIRMLLVLMEEEIEQVKEEASWLITVPFSEGLTSFRVKNREITTEEKAIDLMHKKLCSERISVPDKNLFVARKETV